jgi:hypothetical protein
MDAAARTFSNGLPDLAARPVSRTAGLPEDCVRPQSLLARRIVYCLVSLRPEAGAERAIFDGAADLKSLASAREGPV